MAAVPTIAPEEYARRVRREPRVIWVCVDCYLTQEGVREDDEPADREPLSLIGDELDVLSGGAHLPGECPNVAADGSWIGESDCDCDRQDFSWSPCQGCGSTLGGAREALTLVHR